MDSRLVAGMVFLVLTIAVYAGAKKINRRFPHPLTLPVLVSSVVLVILMLLFRIPYEVYMAGGQWIDQLLGPAVVALALPLYKQRKILWNFALPIAAGVICGSVIGIGSGFFLTWIAGFETEISYSMIPKSVTTPVAISIVEPTGGIPSLTAIFVIIAGITGAVIQYPLFHYVKLAHFIGRGVGMGTASHAIGTARSMETSEKEGAVSTVAMTLSAIAVSFLVPLFLWIL